MADPDWTNERTMRKLRELQPELFQKFVDFEQAVYEPRKLSTKTKELIAVAVTYVTQCRACMALHTRNAKVNGATDEEIAEAIFVAMELRAGAALGHFGTSADVMEKHRHAGSNP
ncbi:MAG: carboxymuconolactone decarboxylase family protein [Candidatus Binataceae bacterium]|jgi:AhpD family alkylhydroperoxidase